MSDYGVLMRSGVRVDVDEPMPEHFESQDIARCLVRHYRFSGNIDYTVAAHSLVVGELAAMAAETTGTTLARFPARTTLPADVLRMVGRLHDATEAYMGDLARDIKKSSRGAGYRQIEASFMEALWKRYGLKAWEVERAWPYVKEADEWALEAEVELFWPPHLRPRFGTKHPTEAAVRETLKYCDWGPHKMRAFLERELESWRRARCDHKFVDSTFCLKCGWVPE